MEVFENWTLKGAVAPWTQLYAVSDANYPPGAMLFFEWVGRFYLRYIHNDPGQVILRVLIKLPAIVFDLVGGLAAYVAARRFVPGMQAVVAAMLIDFNPAIVYDSADWGQNDSITAACALAAIAALVHHKRVAAWLLLAFAILNKPPILVLVPLFALEPFFNGEPSGRIRRLAQASGGVLLSLVLGYLLALPFYADRDVISIYRDMINWYQVGSSLYPVNSANAFNLFAFSNDFFESDTTMYGALALRYWADALFIAAAAVVYWFSAYRGNDRSIVKGAFLLMLGFFCFLTEMHERYLIYALFLVAPLVVFDVRYRWFAAVLTITLWLNLDYSLTYMWLGGDNPNGVDARQFAPVLARLCAGANIVVFIGGLLALAQQASDKLLPLPECPLRPRPIEPA